MTFAVTLTSIGVRVSPVPCNDRAPTSPTIRIGAAAKTIAR
jgi:hypothetical protein